MRELIYRYLGEDLSRRGFMRSMAGIGFSAAAAQTVLESLEASELAALGSAVSNAEWVEGTGGDLIVAQAKAAGTEYLFTNPGSFEVGLFDAFLNTPGMQLIVGLHEGIVLSLADGYHRVSRKPAFVNVHVVAGTAQMAGQLYNASRDGSAIVITAGLNDNEVWSDEATLAPRPGFDQKEINRQFTKISWEARQPESLALMLRRAFKVSTTSPGGPVYLALADYALAAKGVKANILPPHRFMIPTRVRPEAAAVEEAARLLLEAKRPLLVVGDEVWKSGAQAELVSLSEGLGLAVAAGDQGFRNFPVKHPHYLGEFEMDSNFVEKGVDLIVFVGARDFGGRVIPSRPEVPPAAEIVRIGMDTASMGRNHPTDLALVGDVRETLKDLSEAVEGRVTRERMKKIAEGRSEEVRSIVSRQWARVETAARSNFGQSPIHPDELGEALARLIDRDAIVVSENLTGKDDFFNFGFRDDEQMRVGNTGASLGWGVGAATGAKLAAPDRQVVCSIGDGSVMYSAAGFWTQARYGVPVLTVVWNNQNYQTVRFAYDRYQGKMATTGRYVGMYLGDPDIDFVKLAESQGVAGEKVERGDQIERALKRGIKATRDGKPYLVEVNIARYGGGAHSTWHQKFDLAQRRKRKV